ncbi:MAG: hypothetical protein HKN91_12520, partial [Acidimicrobiia bacterium]|nr:hypothetical protein [Acidimicrobiia bacterium]
MRKNGSMGALVLLILASALPFSAAEAASDQKPETMAEQGGALTLRSPTKVDVTLTVTGDGHRFRQSFAAGQTPSFVPVDHGGFMLPDGTYRWTLVFNPRLTVAMT